MKRILSIMTIAAVMYMGANFVFAEEVVYTYKTVQVTSGDTMWDIACRFAEPGEDVHEVIFNICRWNKLESKTLYPGQVLKIRVKTTDDMLLAKK